MKKSNKRLTIGFCLVSLGTYTYAIRASNAWGLEVPVWGAILGIFSLILGTFIALSSIEVED